MGNNEEQTEKLINFIDGHLNENDKRSLNDELKSNKNLQNEFDSLLLAKKVIENYGLKQNVANIHNEMMQEFNPVIKKIALKNNIKLIIKAGLQIAAGLIFILFCYGAYQYTTVSSDTLFNKNYVKYEVSFTRGDEIKQTEKLFINADYDGVINFVKSSKQPSATDLFYAAQAYLQKNQSALAINNFKTALKSQDFKLKEDAEYYLALSYLKNNNIKESEKIFKQIKNDHNHLYHDQVSNLTLIKLKVLALKIE